MHGNGWDMIHPSVPIHLKMYGCGKSLPYCLINHSPCHLKTLKYSDLNAQMCMVDILIFGLRNTKISAF